MKTRLLSTCTSYNFEELFKRKGYTWYNRGIYNLNIIGIRSNKNVVTNKYDDVLVVDYKTKTGHRRACFTITTEPGKYYMEHLLSDKGTAILVPGQYKGCWKIGLHKNKYKALCQAKPIQVYRDNNKDLVYNEDPSTIESGIFGINIHRSHDIATVQNIDKYSAGCQVFDDPAEYNAFMRLCNEQAKLYGNSFTYTLIKEEDMI